jgi:hypothetical protein
MPITAFSNQNGRELDLEQWLLLNNYPIGDDPDLVGIPTPLRAKATDDIECSCCGARGAMLVRGARSRGTGKLIGQGHFRFRTADDKSAHHPFCDFFDEQKARGQEYLVNFASDKTALTRAIRDLVCRGIAGGLIGRAEIRAMRLWFMEEKVKYTLQLDVSEELLQWCVDMAAMRDAWYPPRLDFAAEHGALLGFEWEPAAKAEWARRNRHLFDEAGSAIYFWRESGPRALKLLSMHAGAPMLDPSALRDKYEAAVRLAHFAARHLFDTAKSPAIARQHPSDWGAVADCLLALSSLLLHLSDWDLQRASVLYCRLKTVQAVPDGLEGNLVGLNPFHDFPAWDFIGAARRIGAKRVDAQPVAKQVEQLRAEMQAQHAAWAVKEGIDPRNPPPGAIF